jgi:hypothetical protein
MCKNHLTICMKYITLYFQPTLTNKFIIIGVNMGRHEKIAWYNLAVIGTSVLFFLILFFVMKDKRPLELCLHVSSSAFGVLGFLGFGSTLFRKEDTRKMISGFYDPETDERDIQIYRRAGLHAFSIFWVLFVLTIMGFWMYYRWRHGTEGALMVSIDVSMLPALLIPCFIIIVSAHAISTIIQQRDNIKGNNGVQGVFVSNLRSMILSMFFLPIFLLMSFFIAMQGEILFAFQFATATFGAFAMAVREIRRKQDCLEDERLVYGVKLLGRISNVVFTLMYGGLIVKFILDYSKFGLFKFPTLFILLFIALIFHRTVIADLRHYIRERRHEKA